MKRVYIILSVLILTLSLSSCGSPPTVKTDFSAAFTAHSADSDYSGTLNKSGDHIRIVMREPYTVSGMVFDYSDAQLSIKSCGHSTNTDADYLSDNSVPAALRNAVLYLSQASCNGTENGVDSFSVNTPYGEATMTASDGYLTELTEPHSGITFRFTDPSEPIEE